MIVNELIVILKKVDGKTIVKLRYTEEGCKPDRVFLEPDAILTPKMRIDKDIIFCADLCEPDEERI